MIYHNVCGTIASSPHCTDLVWTPKKKLNLLLVRYSPILCGKHVLLCRGVLQEMDSVVTRARHFQFKPDGDVTFMMAQDAVGLPAPLMQVSNSCCCQSNSHYTGRVCMCFLREFSSVYLAIACCCLFCDAVDAAHVPALPQSCE